ncbi:WD repeat-containing protein 20 [Trichinella patagoniensis]|uniref:WD repeat-containing protein 20 n=1 Tax=Trichinella patagoniensis TaxID=990121 RepID=A0A0V0ZZ61_9BILA|nr:WD repeat-containing protein 20 [Trichinella patagoniensis]KRY17958.1 WD repeat-containing protein 20 [Trichinella patagoniensis]
MALTNDSSGAGCIDNAAKEESIKSQFITREGTYKLMTLSEYSRPSRMPLNTTQGNNVAGSAVVHVSFITLDNGNSNGSSSNDDCEDCKEKICFNVGRELYVYNYAGVAKAADLSRPIDKRVYKGTYPTCHDFDQTCTSTDNCELLVGFSAGQIQLINPFKKDSQVVNKLFNEDRLIDKSRVTCLKWIPGAQQHFLASHTSGFLYVYNVELGAGGSLPAYQLFKQGDGFAVHTCKTKSSRNPVYRWTVGEGAVNEFAFSPDGHCLAVVSEDGYLRIFDYHSMELQGIMRSYFGGLLCVAWSPDAKYIVTGGEDDLVTVYSVLEKRTVCRGQGHRSWVSKVAFDPYTSQVFCSADSVLRLDSEEDLRAVNHCISRGCSFRGSVGGASSNRFDKDSVSSVSSLCSVTYRFGSVGHDTLLCLWDLSEDDLKAPTQLARLRNSVVLHHSPAMLGRSASTGADRATGNKKVVNSEKGGSSGSVFTEKASKKQSTTDSANSGSKNKKLLINLTGKCVEKGVPILNTVKTNCAFANAAEHHHHQQQQQQQQQQQHHNDHHHHHINSATSAVLGSPICPYIQDVPIIQPLISKKIAHERLSVLVFREDSIVTACQEGFVCTWARPGRSAQPNFNSPKQTTSPSLLTSGTIV